MRCWYTRWQLSTALDRDGDLQAPLSRGHARRCAACQAFARRLAALHANLSREVAAAPPPQVVRPARSRWLLTGPLVAGAAAVIAISLGAVIATSSDPRPPDRMLEIAPPTQAQATEVIGHLRDLVAEASQIFGPSPLRRELDDLVADGKRGLDDVLATGGLR
jgi:hypothetical protein